MSTVVTEESRPSVRAGSGVAVSPQRVMAMRHIRRLSRQQLADRIAALGLTDDRDRPVRLGKDALGKIETGQRKPSVAAFAALTDALACDPADLTDDGRVIEMPQWVIEKQERLDENTGLRMFAAEHGLRYSNPANGRVYYGNPLREAYAAWQDLERARSSGDYEVIEAAQAAFRSALAQAPRKGAHAPAELIAS